MHFPFGMPPAPDRVFQVWDVGVVINDLTIQGGDVSEVAPATPEMWGGGVKVEPGGALELNNSVVRGNSADFGGGIYNEQGHVELHGSLVGGGAVGGSGGAPNVATNEGGGIFTVGGSSLTLIVDASSVDGNVALSHGGGIYNADTVVAGDRVEIINGSSVSSNVAGGSCLEEEPSGGGNGGGIWTDAPAELDGGSPTADSPGVFIDGSTVSLNQALECAGGGAGGGGGIYNVGGHVETTGGTVVDDNQADNGGGIWTAGPDTTVVLLDTTVADNVAGSNGGGIYNSFDEVIIEQSTVSGNTAENGYGGGIYTLGNGLFALNSTISGNSAETAEEVEVEPGSGLGGGIYLNSGSFDFHSVTLSANSADDAGGNIAIGNIEGDTGFLFNTIVAGGTPENCSLDEGDDLDSLGYNLSTENPDSCGLEDGTDILGADPLLGPLQYNGGQTDTHALGLGSPAIDSGPAGGPPKSAPEAEVQEVNGGCPPVDQREISRPRDGDGDGIEVCDRGAYERRSGPPEGAGEEPPGPPAPPPQPEVCDITGTSGPDILIGTELGESICGLAGDDTIVGGGGDDDLFGDEGDDDLDGGPGNDDLVGGAGEDTGNYAGAPGPVDANLSTGAATGVGASTDTLFELENLRGSPFDDVLTGDGGPNKLRGKDGADRMPGRGGDDIIRGSRGNDTGRGGGGDDTVKGGNDRDKLRGGSGEDTLTGGQDPDDLKGNSGDDDLKGGGANDDLNGNSGTDDCDGGSGSDTIVNCEP